MKSSNKCFVLISSTSKISIKHSRKYGKGLLFVSVFYSSVHSEGKIFLWDPDEIPGIIRSLTVKEKNASVISEELCSKIY